MSADPQRTPRSLPAKPHLRHLKDQAKDLLRAGKAASLADAQFRLARDYGFASWPKLKAHVESLREIGQLKEAINANDVARVEALMSHRPALHHAPLGYSQNGPLTWAAECRGVAATAERLAIAQWMIDHGSDVHQGGDGPLMRAALSDERIPMMELLVKNGADVNALWGGRYPIICAPCETLQPRALQWLIQHGADMNAVSTDYGNCVQMLIGTYCRNPRGKHACLEVFASADYPFPNTAPMAVHRGRIDLLAALVDSDPTLLHRRFSEREIYPAGIGEIGLHVAPLDGVTLLHMAIEYQEVDVAQWLIDHGADVNARAEIDADGFGGHTPLFHTTVTLAIKPDDRMARLLMKSGADPHLRATFRKQLRDMGDSEKEQMYEYRDVSAIDFARFFQEPTWVNTAAVDAILEYGGE